jgi:hypothetical protein
MLCASRSNVCNRQSNSSGRAVSCMATQSRRELMLASVSLPLASVLSIGGAPRPSSIGIQSYGGSVQTLSLCPPTPNCIATSEEANDPTHFVPAWTYNPEDGRGLKKPATQAQAMEVRYPSRNLAYVQISTPSEYPDRRSSLKLLRLSSLMDLSLRSSSRPRTTSTSNTQAHFLAL